MVLLPLILAATPRILVVGGGPNRRYNQVAIESNVRYMGRVVPKGWPLRVLFADGDADRATVRYTPDGQSVGRDDKYRVPQLPRLDGPAMLDDVRKELAQLATVGNRTPVFLYFTGHGSLAADLTPDTSQFDLWSRQRITVPQMADSLARFNRDVPLVLLMVQCHSGGFAKLLFPNGDPKQPPLDNRFCGFFASVEARPAAGCTPEVNEADYHDFTGYFLAALVGQDRLGRPAKGADYDGNGKVGMNEAFCWAIANDDSIDTPVCTSDEFLRSVVKMEDREVFATPYANVLKWASPAQRGAIESLSKTLKLEGEDRLAVAYGRYIALQEDDGDLDKVRGFRLIRLCKSVVLGHAVASLPNASLKKRYATLLKDEAANPLLP